MSDKPVCELTKPDERGNADLLFYCPGCRSHHGPRVGRTADDGKPFWTWNGDVVKPTLAPSLVVRVGPMPTVPVGRPDAGKIHVCHSFVRDGRIEFLSDCTHALAGQTVPLEPMD